MKNVKILTAITVVSIFFMLIVTKANAVAVEGGKKKLVVCAQIDETGTTTMGNTCDSGSNVCISNPCP